MTLEELKAAMDAAKAELDKKPDDSALKSKYEAAKQAYEAKAKETVSGEGDSDETDESKWDEKTKAYIAKLRREAAENRTKAKDYKSKLAEAEEKKKAILKAAGIEEESEAPEEKLKESQIHNNTLTFRNAILETALEQGIAKEDVDYFSYLVEKKTSELKDDEELSDEQMAQIVADVKKRGGGGKANTSVGNGGKGGSGSGNPPAEDGNGQITLDQFVKMTFSEKTKLYGKNPELYNSLMNEAKRSNRLV